MNNNSKVTAKRPLAITIISLVGILVSAYGLFRILSQSLAGLPEDTITKFIRASLVIATLVAYIGMWRMKKWGIYLYAGLFPVYALLSFLLGQEASVLSHQSKMLVLDKGLKPLVGTRFLLADFRTLA